MLKEKKPKQNGVASKQEEEEEVEYKMADPPDGGWGWVVVFSAFMIHVIVDGITYTFGIFYYEFLRYFQESKGKTSWITSIMVGITFCIGPVASGLTNKFGCRTVTIIGSILAAFGLVLSTVAPNVTYLFFTIGILTGSGFGLIYLPAIVCVTCYFEKKRAFATGIAVCGSGIGTFVFAPLIEWMVAELGWKGAMLVVAGMVLNCCVFGALFRPLEEVAVPKPRRQITITSPLGNPTVNGIIKDIRKGSLPNGTLDTNGDLLFGKSLTTNNFQMSTLSVDHPRGRRNSTDPVRMSRSMTIGAGDSHSRRRTSSTSTTATGPLNRKDVFYSGSVVNLPEYQSNPSMYSSRMMTPTVERAEVQHKSAIHTILCPSEMTDAFHQMMDFRLMLNVIFLMFGFSNFFTNIGFNVPYLYIKDRAIDMEIAEEKNASYLLSVIGIANTVGRVVLGYLSDRPCMNRLWLYNGSLTLCGVATVLSSFCTDYTLMSLYAAVFGATAGAYVSLTSVILVDLLGLDKLTNAFGLLLVFEGVACLIGPPITGLLYDYTGSYDPGFHVSGFMIALSGLMLFLIPCMKTDSTQEKTKNIMICDEANHAPSPV